MWCIFWVVSALNLRVWSACRLLLFAFFQTKRLFRVKQREQLTHFKVGSLFRIGKRWIATVVCCSSSKYFAVFAISVHKTRITSSMFHLFFCRFTQVCSEVSTSALSWVLILRKNELSRHSHTGRSSRDLAFIFRFPQYWQNSYQIYSMKRLYHIYTMNAKLSEVTFSWSRVRFDKILLFFSVLMLYLWGNPKYIVGEK